MFFQAILGSIIIAALYNLFKQLSDLKHYWKIDKIDFVRFMKHASAKLNYSFI